jgi:cyanophycinase
MIAPILLCLLLSMPADAPAGFKGPWQGPLVREGATNVLTLIIDDISDGEVHGRLLNNGAEYAPISEAKVQGNHLTFRADTLQFETDLADDALDATLTISHGRTFHLTLHRIADAEVPHPPVPAPAPAGSPLPILKTSEIPRATRSAGAPGTLILVGGGVNAPAILRRFTEVTKGGPIVVIPTALDDRDLSDERLKFLRTKTADLFQSSEVAVLHTRDRAVADSEEFVKPILRARGIWMLGGEEANLLRSYQGTRTETEMKKLLERGGVVGGTSAGAIVQVSAVPSADGHSVVRGFGFLPGAIVWPHWSERRAENDLVKYANQFQLLGIGIDEATAIVVHGDGFEVVGDGHVGIVDGNTHDGKDYYLLNAGKRFKMKPRKVVSGGKADAFAEAMAAYGEDRFRGNVLAARNGTVLFHYENTPVRKFRIGSASPCVRARRLRNETRRRSMRCAGNIQLDCAIRSRC